MTFFNEHRCNFCRQWVTEEDNPHYCEDLDRIEAIDTAIDMHYERMELENEMDLQTRQQRSS